MDTLNEHAGSISSNGNGKRPLSAIGHAVCPPMEQAKRTRVCELPFYDEAKCQRPSCELWAKFCNPDGDPLEALCGRHCNKTQSARVELDKSRYEQFQEEGFREPRRQAVESATLFNLGKGKCGDVEVIGHKSPNGHKDVRLLLSHPSYRGSFYKKGFLSVFPNFKHGSTVNGFGCSALSPKSMGPINHSMAGLPVATSIENYHQFSKVFPCDVDINGDPSQAWLEQRKQGYSDPKPHRHSPSADSASGNKNTPLYSVYYHPGTGEERRYTYLESRVFYSVWYERIARQLDDFKRLNELKEGGTNLQIVGYDGYSEGVVEPLWECFNDTSRPFGHELVLFTMLTVEDPCAYPWNRFRGENFELYDGML